MDELPFCKCGCGERIIKKGNKWVNGHNGYRDGLKAKPKPEPKLCACGCGEYAKSGNRFILGHANRGRKLIMRHRRKNAKEKILIVCENCGVNFEDYELSNRRFCSRKCWWEWRGKNERGKSHPLYKEKDINVCEICGIEFEVHPYEKGRMFCSHNCYWLWMKLQSGEKSPAWKGGISFEPYCPKFTGQLKQQIRDHYNNCDFFSGLPDYICNVMNGKVWELDIHHVDYNKMQGCEGHKWLLIPLSHRNHTKTNANRSFWEKLICYVLEYDETYYDEEIINIMEMINYASRKGANECRDILGS